MRFELKAILQFFFDVLLVLWAVSPLAKTEEEKKQLALCAVCLLLTAPLYFFVSVVYFLRVLFRFSVYVLAIWLISREPPAKCVYLASLLTVLFTATQNVFFSPLLLNIYRCSWVFTGVRSFDFAFCIAIQWSVYAIVFFYTFSMIKIDRLGQTEPVEWMIIALAITCELYIKQALPIVSSAGGDTRVITVFSVILNLMMIAFLGSFVRFLRERRRTEEIRLQEAMNTAYFNSLEMRKQCDEDVRRLYHDMKNHLLALDRMAASDSERISAYIGAMAKGLEPYENLIETGNELLNGILSEKMAKAAKRSIRMEIQADCRMFSFIDDMDLCTIFGNALDNAIEACEKVDPPEERSIRVKSLLIADQIFLTVVNSCLGKVDLTYGLPLTTKKEAGMHGVGLRSIRRCLEKYNGNLRCKAEDGRFTLTIGIPCPERLEKEE